jgi:hypothetical protein
MGKGRITTLLGFIIYLAGFGKGGIALAAVEPSGVDLYKIVDSLASAPLKNEKEVEKLTGALLELVTDDGFPLYRSPDNFPGVGRGNILIKRVEYWKQEGGSYLGATVTFEISGVCLSRETVFRRYGPPNFLLLSTPPDPEAGFGAGVNRRWGKLSFTFSHDLPECLREVTLEKFRRNL